MMMQPTTQTAAPKENKQELRLIVRILNKDLKGEKPVFMSLQGIKGIGQRLGHVLAMKFQQETGIPYNTMMGNIPESADKKLEDIISNPAKYQIPIWMFNRQGMYETGESIHQTQNELDFTIRNDLERAKRIKSYKGIRHMFGQPVRGQRTRSSFRTRGRTVGVQKKDQASAKGGAKPAAAAAPAKDAGKKK